MQNRIMITNGGPHPPSLWAEKTASFIVEITEHISQKDLGTAIKLQASIIDILEKHHTIVQKGERSKLIPGDGSRILKDADPTEHVEIESIIQEIIATSDGSPWEQDFHHEEFIVLLRKVLVDHFASNIKVERSWHADKHPGLEEAKTYKAIYHPGV